MNKAIVLELLGYMKNRKKYWLGPILVMLLLLGLFILFTESTALAPFIYPLF